MMGIELDFFLFTQTIKLNLWVTEQLNKAKLFY